MTRSPLGNKPSTWMCLVGARDGQVETKKGKNRPKSHRVESHEFKLWKWEFNFSLFKQEQNCYLHKGMNDLTLFRDIGMRRSLLDGVNAKLRSERRINYKRDLRIRPSFSPETHRLCERGRVKKRRKSTRIFLKWNAHFRECGPDGSSLGGG